MARRGAAEGVTVHIIRPTWPTGLHRLTRDLEAHSRRPSTKGATTGALGIAQPDPEFAQPLCPIPDIRDQACSLLVITAKSVRAGWWDIPAMVDVAVIGARGYLGRELMRLLVVHPEVAAVVPITSGDAGRPYGDSVPAFRHRRDLVMANAEAARDADVVFLATDGEEAQHHAANLAEVPLIVDLSRAHRAQAFEG